MPRPDPARQVAYALLRAVREQDAYANLAMPRLQREHRLEPRDAAFATELGYGTLRRHGTYDAVLARCVDRPLTGLDPPLLDVLRLGTHQLLAMRVPTHAAVSATVELARAELGDARSRLVNAVLRKVARRDLDQWLAEVAPNAETDLVGHLAVVHSHPRWVVEALRRALGNDAELPALLAADNEAPAVSLVVRPGRASVEELIAAGATPGRWSPYAATLTGGAPADLPAVAQGRAAVQDEGSQLVALALAAAPIEGRDQFWLDLCAGPGGKAALLAGVGAQRGAHLLAAELAPHRARMVAGALRGSTGVVVDADDATTAESPAVVPGSHAAAVVVADGRWPFVSPGSVDRVLVDAPCTGLGALRRRPEARWRRTPAHVEPLAALQRALLRSALDAVRQGGVVAYATCSPHLAETRDVVRAVLADRPDVELLDARPYLPGVPDLGDGPEVQLWPHKHGTDAMFLALLRRR